jgi:histone H3
MPDNNDATSAEPAPTEGDAPRPAKRKARREFSIPKVSFRRLVQEIASEYKSDLRFQQEALDALQESSENLIIEQFHRCSELADLCKLDTVREEHWRFVREVPCSGTS